MSKPMRMSLIDLGELTADHGWFFEGAGKIVSTASDPKNTIPPPPPGRESDMGREESLPFEC